MPRTRTHQWLKIKAICAHIVDYVACDWEIQQNYDKANINVLFDRLLLNL